jgi:hypothetical protein
MVQSTYRFDPQHWRDRANEARANAAKMDDPDAKRLMLEIAVTYDHLAKRAEDGGIKAVAN